MNRPLYVRLLGGLGNQMFQYAAALSLARRVGLDVTVDIQDLERDRLRFYALDRLKVGVSIASKEQTLIFRQAIRWGRVGAWSLYMRRLLLLREKRLFEYQELNMNYIFKRAWMSGFWQNWRYGQSVAGELKKVFKVRSLPKGRNLDLLRKGELNKGVCLHIRRGDYATNPKVKARHGLISVDYYRIALRRLGPNCGKVFVFSDDPSWVRRYLKLGRPFQLVDHNNSDQAEEDLRLMSACRHFVIANSSLSWWAAWLGGHPQKKVFAPERWFAEPMNNIRDLLPSDWERI